MSHPLAGTQLYAYPNPTLAWVNLNFPASHKCYQRPVGRVIEAHPGVIVHRPSHERSCRTLLNKRLVIGGSIREMLSVEHIVTVKKQRPHVYRVIEFRMLLFVERLLCRRKFQTHLRLAVVIAVDTQIYSEAAPHRPKRDSRAVTVGQLLRQPQSVASIAKPRDLWSTEPLSSLSSGCPPAKGEIGSVIFSKLPLASLRHSTAQAFLGCSI